MKRLLVALLSLVAASPTLAQDLLQQFPVRPGGNGKPPARRAASAPQSQRAKKGAFPVIKASDAALKRAVSATDLAGARKLVGKRAMFVGTVAKVFAPRSNSIVLLNFARSYKTALVGAVKPKDYVKFPPLAGLVGKRVLVSGRVISFKGQTEVELDAPGSIRVVK